MKLYLNNRKDTFDAIAEYNLQTGEFVVLKGSRVSEEISTAPTFKSIKTIIKQRGLFVYNNIVQEDVVFRSSSSAGNFVTGHSTDGPSAWKDKSGKKLKEILSE